MSANSRRRSGQRATALAAYSTLSGVLLDARAHDDGFFYPMSVHLPQELFHPASTVGIGYQGRVRPAPPRMDVTVEDAGSRWNSDRGPHESSAYRRELAGMHHRLARHPASSDLDRGARTARPTCPVTGGSCRPAWMSMSPRLKGCRPTGRREALWRRSSLIIAPFLCMGGDAADGYELMRMPAGGQARAVDGRQRAGLADEAVEPVSVKPDIDAGELAASVVRGPPRHSRSVYSG